MKTFREFRVWLLAIITGMAGLLPAAFGYLSSSDGVTIGENIQIAFEMLWPDMAMAVTALALLFYADIIGKFLLRELKFLRFSHYHIVRGNDRRAKIGSYTILSLASLLLVVFMPIFLISSIFIVKNEIKYLTRSAQMDFKYRHVNLAESYIKAYKFDDADRIFHYLDKHYGDVFAQSRIAVIRERKRHFILLSDLAKDQENRLGLVPANAYRKAAIYLMSPYEPDNGILLAKYKATYRDALGSHLWLLGRCRRGHEDRDLVIGKLKLLVEPEILRGLVRAAGDPLRWYCRMAKVGSYSEQVIRERWQYEDIARLTEIRAARRRGVIPIGSAPQ